MALSATMKTDLYRYFAVAFDAAPGATYMTQLADAANSGMTIQQIVEVFTTKPQFTSVYPNYFTNAQFADKLIETVVGSSATAEAKSEAKADIEAALALGGEWTRGKVIYQIFNNLANKAADDAVWGGTSKMMANQVAYAQYYTEVIVGDSTDMAQLRAVIANVTATSSTTTADMAAALSQGQTFMLTASADKFVGTAAYDTFTAATGSVGSGVDITVLGALDDIDGGNGIDTFKLNATETSNNTLLGSVKNVEKIVITGSDHVAYSQTAAQIQAVKDAEQDLEDAIEEAADSADMLEMITTRANELREMAQTARQALSDAKVDADAAIGVAAGANGAVSNARTAMDLDALGIDINDFRGEYTPAVEAVEAVEADPTATPPIEAVEAVEAVEESWELTEVEAKATPAFLAALDTALITVLVNGAVAGASVTQSKADNAVAKAVIEAAGQTGATLATVEGALTVAVFDYIDALTQAAQTVVDLVNEYYFDENGGVNPPWTVPADFSSLQTQVAGVLAEYSSDDIDDYFDDMIDAMEEVVKTADANVVIAEDALSDAQEAMGGSNVDASFFKGSTDIAVDGKITTVSNVTGQTVEFNGGAGMANTVAYDAAAIAGKLLLTSSSGNLFVKGSKLATLDVSGSVTKDGTVTLDDTTPGGTVKTINLAITTAATMNVTEMTGRTTINAANSTGALTIEVGNTLGTAEVVTGGSAADTLVAEIDKVVSYNPTIDGVETLDLNFSANGTFNASKVTGATTLDISSSDDAKVTNLAASVKTLVTKADNNGDINLAYAAAAPGTLTWNIGKKDAAASIQAGDLVTTNVSSLTVNAAGSLKTGSDEVGHGANSDIYVDKTLTDFTMTTSTKGVGLNLDYLYARNSGGLDGLKTMTLAGDKADLLFYGMGEDGAKNLETFTVTAQNGATVELDYAYAVGVDADGEFETSSLETVTVNATAKSSANIEYLYAGGFAEYSDFNGVAASNPEVTLDVDAVGEAAHANIYDYTGGSISTMHVSAVGARSVASVESLYVYGVSSLDSNDDEVYVSGGNIGEVNVEADGAMAIAAVGVYEDSGLFFFGCDDMDAESNIAGSVGEVNVTLRNGGHAVVNLNAGTSDMIAPSEPDPVADVAKTFGSIGPVTVTAEEDAGISYVMVSAHDEGKYTQYSKKVQIESITVSAAKGASLQALMAESEGSIGDINATYNNAGLFSEDLFGGEDNFSSYYEAGNMLMARALGTVGDLNLTQGSNSNAQVMIGSETASVGEINITVGSSSDSEIMIGAATTIGDITASVAAKSNLAINISAPEDGALEIGSVTVTGSGNAWVSTSGSAESIGIVDLSALTGEAYVDLSAVRLGSPSGNILIGTGGSNVVGTDGNDVIILTAGTSGSDLIQVQTGMVLDQVRNFNTSNDQIELNSDTLMLNGSYAQFSVASGIATGGTLAQFKALVATDTFAQAGVLGFYDANTNSMYVAYTDDVSGIDGDQIIQLVGVTSANLDTVVTTTVI